MKNMRVKSRLITFIAAAVIICPAIMAKAGKTFAPDGPYKVGVLIEHVELEGRTAPVMIWYPADTGCCREPYKYMGKLLGAAVYGAPAARADAPYPLIIFSHGLGGCGCQSIYYTENLASYGYVVVALDHRDSLMCHIEGEPDIGFGKIAWSTIKSGGNLTGTVMALFGDVFEETGHDFSYRSPEASAEIDRALVWNDDPAHPMYKMMDSRKIGITGHSLGGFTSLMVGGVPFHCENFDPAPGECDMEEGDIRSNIDPCCMNKDSFIGAFELRDERVKAMVPLGPAIFFPDLERAASEIEIPLMVITGSNKKMEVPWDPIWTLYTNAPAPKYLLRLKKTDHMTIADQTLSGSPLVKLFLPGFRFHYKDKAQAYKDYSVAFFDLYLKGDDSKAAALSSPTSRFVELWQEAE